MKIADRVRELRRVRAAEVVPNPRNWRTHPVAQRRALSGILAEVGYAAALIARQRDDGTLELIDGHLRAEITPDTEVPVLIVELTDDEAAKVLATLDPLAAMAECDAARLADVVRDIETQDEAVADLLAKLTAPVELPAQASQPTGLQTSYQIVVTCKDENEQRGLYERLADEGFECRVLSL